MENEDGRLEAAGGGSWMEGGSGGRRGCGRRIEDGWRMRMGDRKRLGEGQDGGRKGRMEDVERRGPETIRAKVIGRFSTEISTSLY
jgi:hypothetical protein